MRKLSKPSLALCGFSILAVKVAAKARATFASVLHYDAAIRISLIYFMVRPPGIERNTILIQKLVSRLTDMRLTASGQG